MICSTNNTGRAGIGRVLSVTSPYVRIALDKAGDGAAAADVGNTFKIEDKIAEAGDNAGFPREETKAEKQAEEASPFADLTDEPAKAETEAGTEEKAEEKTEGDEKPDVVDDEWSPTIPEDMTDLSVDEGLLASMRPAFAKAGLTKAQAQTLAEEYGRQVARAQMTQQVEQEKNNTQTIVKAYQNTEGGVKGAAKHAERAATQFFGRDGLRALTDAGLAKHPAVFSALVKIGKSLADDTVREEPRGEGQENTDPAYILYPNDRPKQR